MIKINRLRRAGHVMRENKNYKRNNASKTGRETENRLTKNGMDGRTDGRMDGWMDGRMDGWMDGWMGGWMDGWMVW
jgi:hypothetical protein